MMKPKKKPKKAKRVQGGHRPLSQPEKEFIMTFCNVAPVKQLAFELMVSESAVYRVIRIKTDAIRQAEYDLKRFLKSLELFNNQCKVFREGEIIRSIGNNLYHLTQKAA